MSFLHPVYEVAASCGPVTVRWPTYTELSVYLGKVAAGGLDDVGYFMEEPFGADTEEIARNVYAYAQTCSSNIVYTVTPWVLYLGVFVDDVMVGVQTAHATPTTHASGRVETGSMLLHDARGAGVGRRARVAVLELLFTAGARKCTTSFFDDNVASRTVSERCGYVVDGAEQKWHVESGRERTLVRASIVEHRFREVNKDLCVEVAAMSDEMRELLAPQTLR